MHLPEWEPQKVSGPELPTSRNWPKASIWLTVACTVLAPIGAILGRGMLRRRIGRVHQIVPGSTISRPLSVVLERHGDGEYHYGLLFHATWRGRYTRLSWYSVLDTRLCDRGPVQGWQGHRGQLENDKVEVVVFLPRSWLILQGFLPLQAAIWRRQPYPLQDSNQLLDSFWLESFADQP